MLFFNKEIVEKKKKINSLWRLKLLTDALSLQLFLMFPLVKMLCLFLFPPGQITLAEFMEGAQKDEWVMRMLKLDVNATGWVIQNCGMLP